MKTIRYKTDRWMWFGVSIGLFVVGCFVPFNYWRGQYYARGCFFSIYKWVKHWIKGDVYGDVVNLYLGPNPYPMGQIICLWVALSILVGWWIQRVIVKSRARNRDENDHEA